MKYFLMGIILIFAAGAGFLLAEEEIDLDLAQVTEVKAVRQGETWTFHVTVRHNDEGWTHYANVWQVVDPETEEVLAERILAHPHDNEQPFTRSLSGIAIPEDLDTVRVRAGCNVHNFGGAEMIVVLSPDAENP